MPKDGIAEDLTHLLRELSLQIDSTALELRQSCTCQLVGDLFRMSERLSHTADAMESPSLGELGSDCLLGRHASLPDRVH